MSDLNLLKTWRELSKSGIVALVLISVFAGYLVGQPSELPISLQRLFTTLVGILLLASGSSALNQWQEREIDALMPRTAGRPLPSGKLSPQKVLIFVFLTLTSGLALLAFLSSELLLLGLLAVLLYNGLYTLWWKRHWAYAAVPGAIPGAIPILMGHVAANGKITSPSGLYLFFILFLPLPEELDEEEDVEESRFLRALRARAEGRCIPSSVDGVPKASQKSVFGPVGPASFKCRVQGVPVRSSG